MYLPVLSACVSPVTQTAGNVKSARKLVRCPIGEGNTCKRKAGDYSSSNRGANWLILARKRFLLGPERKPGPLFSLLNPPIEHTKSCQEWRRPIGLSGEITEFYEEGASPPPSCPLFRWWLVLRWRVVRGGGCWWWASACRTLVAVLHRPTDPSLETRNPIAHKLKPVLMGRSKVGVCVITDEGGAQTPPPRQIFLEKNKLHLLYYCPEEPENKKIGR